MEFTCCVNACSDQVIFTLVRGGHMRAYLVRKNIWRGSCVGDGKRKRREIFRRYPQTNKLTEVYERRMSPSTWSLIWNAQCHLLVCKDVKLEITLSSHLVSYNNPVASFFGYLWSHGLVWHRIKKRERNSKIFLGIFQLLHNFMLNEST